MDEHLTFTFTFIILLLLNPHMYIPVAPLPVSNLINGDEKHIRTLIPKFWIGSCPWFPSLFLQCPWTKGKNVVYGAKAPP